MQVIDRLLDFLKNGEWHSINEISAQKPLLKLTISQVREILNFLSEYGFIELTQSTPIQAKLTPSTQKFLKEISIAKRT